MPSEPSEASAAPLVVRRGAFRAYFIYDVADSIDLSRVPRISGEDVARAPLQLRREATPGHIQFPVPPLVARLGTPDEFPSATLRAKIFDYGVVSIRVSVPVDGPWEHFASETRRLRVDARLEALARHHLEALLIEMATALDDPHPPQVEDYFVFEVERFEPQIGSEALLGAHANAVASLILGESRRLTASERDEALRVSFSYFEDELVVVQWDAAFVFERPEGAAATEDILEFANTQLVELRTYDQSLDAELDTIYGLDPKNAGRRFGRKRAQAAADRLRFIKIDVLELADRAGNSLKIIGDAYYARLYRGAAGRLGLKDWQQQVDAKLASVDDLYRFFNDQAQAARGEFMEAVVILLIALEIVLGLVTLRH